MTRHILILSCVAGVLALTATSSTAQNMQDKLELLPLPVEPVFAEEGNRMVAASLMDLRVEASDLVKVYRDGGEMRMPLPEEPKK